MALSAKPAPSPAAGSTPSGIPGLCAVASELTALLEQETRLLRAMRINEIAPLQADKLRLTKLCGTTLKSIDPKAPVAKPLKDQWRAISKRLGDAAIANEMALRVGHAATDKLVSAIVGHIERRQSAKNGYMRPRPNAPATLRRSTLAGVTVDRRL
ncbi:MAG TPA: hypothetical protein VKV32_10040 [Stellaceae bacterium]|nr:hypothetical protein [Stellaceae bacterium]